MTDKALLAEVHALHDQLANDLWAVYNKHVAEKAGAGEGKVNHVKFARLAMITFARVSSIIAVDTHMSEEAFVQMCRDNHKLSEAAAPKFT